MSTQGRLLTTAQEKALHPGVRLIEAGPGAGKTHTVINRFHRRASVGAGVALLSFTNRAVDVARTRCRDTPSLLQPPHFIGTFDSFFHRYALTPHVQRESARAPRYVSSWNDLADHLATVRPRSGGQGIPLSSFVPDGQGGWCLDEARLIYSQACFWNRLSAFRQREILSVGSKRIGDLHNQHIYDPDEARVRALALLQKVDSPVLRRLTHRFTEVIVDEFQDCNEVEHSLLQVLRQAGTHVVAVADPDQAIYEFRGTKKDGSSNPYLSFRSSLPDKDIVTLDTCFRSTAVICALTTSLRSIGATITPHETAPTGPDVIHVVVGSGVTAGAVAAQIIRNANIELAGVRVLAHRRKDAQALTREGTADFKGDSRAAYLLRALSALHTQPDARARLAALTKVEAFILKQVEWPSESLPSTRAEQLQALNLSADELRVHAHRLVVASRLWTIQSDCADGVRSVMSDIALAVPCDLMAGWARGFRMTDKLWSTWGDRTRPSDMERLTWSHTHGVKGEEFEAVILALPSMSYGGRHVLDDWQDGTNSEARRVLYVGVSRARCCLVLVTPSKRKAQIVTILKDAQVDYELHESAPAGPAGSTSRRQRRSPD